MEVPSSHPRSLHIWWELIPFQIAKSILRQRWERDEKWKVRPYVLHMFCPLRGMVSPTAGLPYSADLVSLVSIYFRCEVGEVFEFYGVVFSVKRLYDNSWVVMKMNFLWAVMLFSLVPNTALQIKCGFHGSDSFWFFTLAKYTLTF